MPREALSKSEKRTPQGMFRVNEAELTLLDVARSLSKPEGRKKPLPLMRWVREAATDKAERVLRAAARGADEDALDLERRFARVAALAREAVEGLQELTAVSQVDAAYERLAAILDLVTGDAPAPLEVLPSGERIALRRDDEVVAVLVSEDEARLLEKIEDAVDAELLRQAKAEGGDPIPFREAVAELVRA